MRDSKTSTEGKSISILILACHAIGTYHARMLESQIIIVLIKLENKKKMRNQISLP
jgi:hypothetical protein